MTLLATPTATATATQKTNGHQLVVPLAEASPPGMLNMATPIKIIDTQSIYAPTSQLLSSAHYLFQFPVRQVERHREFPPPWMPKRAPVQSDLREVVGMLFPALDGEQWQVSSFARTQNELRLYADHGVGSSVGRGIPPDLEELRPDADAQNVDPVRCRVRHSKMREHIRSTIKPLWHNLHPRSVFQEHAECLVQDCNGWTCQRFNAHFLPRSPHPIR